VSCANPVRDGSDPRGRIGWAGLALGGPGARPGPGRSRQGVDIAPASRVPRPPSRPGWRPCGYRSRARRSKAPGEASSTWSCRPGTGPPSLPPPWQAWLAATCGRTSAGWPTRSPGWAAACCTNAPCSTPSGLRFLARPACRALRRRCAGAAQGAGAGWRGRHPSVRSGAFGVAHDRAGPRYAFHRCSPPAHRAPCGGRTSRFAPSRRGPGRARRDERSDLVPLGQLRGGTIRVRQVAPQPALPRPARQPVLRGARQQFGRRRAGVIGPDYPRAAPPGIRPRRVGFGRRGRGDCSASCYAPLGRLSFDAVSSRHPVGVGW